MEKVSEEYEKFLNWCEDKWTLDYKWKKLLSKLSNDDIDFLKDQYKTRLKADMVAMLTDIQLEIHKLENPYPHDYDNLLPLAQHNAFYDAKSTIEDLVEQKIDKLKEQTDDSN